MKTKREQGRTEDFVIKGAQRYSIQWQFGPEISEIYQINFQIIEIR